MKTIKWNFSLALLLFLICGTKHDAYSQMLANMVNVVSYGATDTADYAPIFINSDGKVIIAGNQQAVAQGYDATISAQLSNGAVAWQDAVASGNKAFTTASTHDAFGNVYVVGGVYINPTNDFDYFLAKYSSTGSQLWITYYNGTNSTIDIASALCLDASGNIYVTGASEGTGLSMIDYATVKYNSSGGQLWVSRYNFSNFIDVPIGIAITGTNKVTVSGSSGSSILAWEFATVEYNTSTGVQNTTNRQASTGMQEMVYSMVTDGTGNVYVTGTTGGINPNVHTVKLDTSLVTVWTRTLDLHGYNDAGVGIALDNNDDVIITGYSYLANGTRELFVRKYDNSGNVLWTKTKKDAQPGSSAEGLRVKVDANNGIFVGGNYTTNGNQDVLMLKYNSSGDLKFERHYNGTSNSTDKFMDFTLDGNTIFISAKTYSTPTVDQNITIQYTTQTFTQGVATTTNNIKYEPKELIIRFHKSAIKMSAINNKQKQFGKLTDFVNDSTCDKITNMLDPDDILRIDAKHFDTRKIFFTMTEADSMAQSRTGGMVKIQPYYCTLLLTMPTTVNNILAAQSLQNIKPDIHHTEMNVYLETASANDPYFSVEQAGLHATAQYANSNVNCDSAWTIQGEGSPFVKVGIIDTGVDFTHPDLGGMTNYGYDFFNQTGPSGDSDNHGTGSAGIIGAVRNNNMGIAGIAGRNDSILGSPQGVTIYDCKACESALCPLNVVSEALSIAITGYGCHIINMSIETWVNFENSYGSVPSYTSTINLMNDANRLGVALVAAKGNLQNTTYPHSLPNYTFPADYTDYTTMSVGSTGRDGHYCVDNVNCSNQSTTGGNIDFVAPGTDSLVYSLNNNQGYQQKDGTSFATPHVSGAVALMMSYRNNPIPNWNNMVHEDCEAILQRTATDLQQSFPYQERVGYDTTTGHGRINIMRAMREINKNYYRFRHITESIGCTSSSRAVQTISTNVNLNWSAIGSFPTGTASTNVYELTSTINYSLLPTETIIDAWPLHKESYGSANSGLEVWTDRPYYSEIVSYSSTQAIMKTYYYSYNLTGAFAPMPSASSHSCAITLYTYDSSGSVNIKERSSVYKNNVKVYPNPSSGEFKLEILSAESTELIYEVNNILGQRLLDGVFKAQQGENKFNLDANSLNQGMYILTIFNGNKSVYSQKIIKN